MKYAMIAVLGLFILWILVETNMGRFYRIAYGDLVPPDITYKGGEIDGFNIVLDVVSRIKKANEHDKISCSTECKWLLNHAPFKQIYLVPSKNNDIQKELFSNARVAVKNAACKNNLDDECIVENKAYHIPIGKNTVVFRKYDISISFYFGLMTYTAYELCLGDKIIARSSLVKWYSKTALADLLRVGHGALGRDMTGSIVEDGNQMERLFEKTKKVKLLAEGAKLCPRNSIGL